MRKHERLPQVQKDPHLINWFLKLKRRMLTTMNNNNTNNNEQEHFENQIGIPSETLEQLKKEVTEYATRTTKTLHPNLDCLSEEYLNHFQQTYNINLDIAILQLQNPYHNTPGEDCWSGCDSDYYDANSGRLWYCPRNT